MPDIVDLNLSHNGIGDAGVEILVQKFSQITKVDGEDKMAVIRYVSDVFSTRANNLRVEFKVTERYN